LSFVVVLHAVQQASNIEAELKPKLTEYNIVKTELSNYEKKQRSAFW